MVARAARGLFVDPICPQTQVAHIYSVIYFQIRWRLRFCHGAFHLD